MRNILRIIVAMIIISLGAYGLSWWIHGMQSGRKSKHAAVVAVSSSSAPPRLAAQQAAAAGRHEQHPAGVSSRAVPAVAHLVYPGPAATQALHLGYATFTHDDNGNTMAVPLPPGTAWQTTLVLEPGDHHRLVFQPTAKKCGFDVDVAIYRADRNRPLWRGTLAAHGESGVQSVDLASIDAQGPLLLTLKMADGAANNWSCNVYMHWGSGGTTHP